MMIFCLVLLKSLLFLMSLPDEVLKPFFRPFRYLFDKLYTLKVLLLSENTRLALLIAQSLENNWNFCSSITEVDGRFYHRFSVKPGSDCQEFFRSSFPHLEALTEKISLPSPLSMFGFLKFLIAFHICNICVFEVKQGLVLNIQLYILF